MKKKLFFICLSGLLLIRSINASAQYRIIHHFAGGEDDGSIPVLGTLIPVDTMLCGMTSEGGSNNIGTIFRIHPDGNGLLVLHSFSSVSIDGQRPFGSLLQDDTVLYGMVASENTTYGGKIFRINKEGNGFQILHSFSGNDGKWPYETLVQSDSILYGFCTYGGIINAISTEGNGNIFRINKNGTGFRVLYTFTGGNDGGAPHCSPLLSGSTLYGTTLWGGNGEGGTIFRIDTNGTGFEVIHHFSGGVNDGIGPYGTTLILSDTTLYGMTLQGGQFGMGTVFKMNSDGGNFSILHSFSGSSNNGRQPLCGKLVLSGSTLFGMTTNGGTHGSGVVFEINTDGTGFEVLHSFAGGSSDGAAPYGSLLMLDSVLYGMTSEGGSQDRGVLFALDIREPGALNTTTLSSPNVLNIFPNPGSGAFTLQFANASVGKTIIEIFNMKGEHIFSETFYHTNKATLNLTGSAAGMYFVRVIADGVLFNQKVYLE